MTDETITTPAPDVGDALRAALSEHREIGRLEAARDRAAAELAELHQQHDAEKLAEEAEQDRLIDEEQAEIERRVREEPPGSMMHAFREAHARGLDTVPADLFDGLTADALRELEAKHRDIYDASLAAFGDAAIKGRI